MKKVIINLSALGVMAIISGCAATDIDDFARKYHPDNVKKMALRSMSGDSATKFISGFGDPVMAKSFSEYYDKKGYSFDHSSNIFHISKQIIDFSENVYMGKANRYVEQLPSENELTKKYKDTILQRGNSYKVLTGNFNKKLIELITGRNAPSFNPEKKLFLKWNLFPAIAEFDKSGELVSLMIGNYTIEAAYGQYNNPNVQSEIQQNVIVYRGSLLNKVRNNITQAMWKENTIKSS
jgi:hypothetical protein